LTRTFVTFGETANAQEQCDQQSRTKDFSHLIISL
jgi:hypothetical protein